MEKVRATKANHFPRLTVSLVNWTEQNQHFALDLNENITKLLVSKHFLVFEFFQQKALGLFKQNEMVDLGMVAPHTSRLLKIIPCDGENPKLAGTDLHFSGGGVGMSEWNTNDKGVFGKINTDWQCSVQITAAFPATENNGFEINAVSVNPGQKSFWINRPKN